MISPNNQQCRKNVRSKTFLNFKKTCIPTFSRLTRSSIKKNQSNFRQTLYARNSDF